MSEFKRVHCVYHTDECITNFCKQQSCLMPLCPSCIGSHNEYHLDKDIRANYLNIFDSLAEAQTAMYGVLVNLEDDKKRNQDVLYLIHSLPGVVHEKIVQAKNLLYNAIEVGFEELEREILISMQRRHDKTGVYSVKMAEKVQADLLVGIGELVQMIDQLKTDKCLSSMIKFYSESQQEFGSLHSKTCSSLYTNEHYHPSIQINQEALSSIKGTISKFIHVHLSSDIPPEFGTISKASRLSRHVPLTTTLPRTSTPTKVVRSTTPVMSGSRISPYPQRILEGPSPGRSRVIHPSPAPPNHPQQSSDYDQQFKQLSRKVKEMRKENEMLSQALRRF